MIDAAGVAGRTGWRVVARTVSASTNDEASALAADGLADRVVVVADRQTAGRGRGGNRFESPAGGLYASLVVLCRARDLPASVVGAAAVALAEAVEAVAGVAARVKWPNDVWIDGKKVAGILLETSGAGSPAGTASVVVGVGVNLRGVPEDLPEEVARATTAIDAHAKEAVTREALLVEFLVRFDGRLTALADPAARSALERDFRARMALIGERVACVVGQGPRCGVLVDVSLERGLLLEEAGGVRSWLAMGHVRDLRREAVVS